MFMVFQKMLCIVILLYNMGSSVDLLAMKQSKHRSSTYNIYSILQEKKANKVKHQQASKVRWTIIIQPYQVEYFLQKHGLNLSDAWFEMWEAKSDDEETERVGQEPEARLFQDSAFDDSPKSAIEKAISDIFEKLAQQKPGFDLSNQQKMQQFLKEMGFVDDEENVSSRAKLTVEDFTQNYISQLESKDVETTGFLGALEEALLSYFSENNIKARQRAGDEYYKSEPYVAIILQKLWNKKLRVGALPTVRQDQLFPDPIESLSPESSETLTPKKKPPQKPTTLWQSLSFSTVAKAITGCLIIAMIAAVPMAQAFMGAPVTSSKKSDALAETQNMQLLSTATVSVDIQPANVSWSEMQERVDALSKKAQESRTELTHKLVNKITDAHVNLKTAVNQLKNDFGPAHNTSVTLSFAIARQNIQNEIINQFDEAARGSDVVDSEMFKTLISKYPQLKNLNGVLQKVINKKSSVLVCNPDKTLRYCVNSVPDAFMAIGRCIASNFAYENIAMALSEADGKILNAPLDEYFTLEEVGYNDKTLERHDLDRRFVNDFSASTRECVPLVTTLRPKDIDYLNTFKINLEREKPLPKGFPVHGSMQAAYEIAKILQNMIGGWTPENVKIVDLSTMRSASHLVNVLNNFNLEQQKAPSPLVVILKNWHIVAGNRAFQTDERLGAIANQWILSMNSWKNDNVIFIPQIPSEVPMSDVDFAMSREARFGTLVETGKYEKFLSRAEPVENVVMSHQDITPQQAFCSRLYGDNEEKWPLHKLDRGAESKARIQESLCQFLLHDKDSFCSIILSGLPGSGKGFIVEKAIFGFMKDYAKEHDLPEPTLVTIEQKDKMSDKVDQCYKILQETSSMLLVFPDEIDSRQNREDIQTLTNFLDVCQQDYADRVFVAGATNFVGKVNCDLIKRFKKEIYIDYLPEAACEQFVKIMTNLGKEQSKVTEDFDADFIREVCKKFDVSPAIVDNTLKIARTTKEGKISPQALSDALLSTMQLHRALHQGFKKGELFLANKRVNN